jgi:23S rRNA pseudouridine2605 synthase
MPHHPPKDHKVPNKRSGPPRPRPDRKPARSAEAAAASTREVREERGSERIAKVMARAGACSRRDAETWIGEGRVAVNGEVLRDPAVNVGESDAITIDGTALPHRARTRLFRFHKPRGLVTTEHDPEGRPTIFDYLREHWPDGPRVVSVGRLDINTEGLILVTNDGGLARVLELPATGWVRRYRVRVNGETDQAKLDTLGRGITIDGVTYAGIEAILDRVQGANCWLTMSLREGKNREIKRVLEHLGLVVNRLIRISFGPFQLGELAEGAIEEVRTKVLRDQLGPSLAKAAGADFTSPTGEEQEAASVSAEAARHHSERRSSQERPARQERRSEPERPARPERRSSHERPARQERRSEPERPARQERRSEPERPARPERRSEPERPARPERRSSQERPARQERGFEPERPARQERRSEPERPARQERRPSDGSRQTSRRPSSSEREAPAAAKVKPLVRVRKHVSVMRRQEAAEQAGPRKRIERAEAVDRSGRVVQVERVVSIAAKPERKGTRNGRRFESLRKGPDDGPARKPRGAKSAASGSWSEAREGRDRSFAPRKSSKEGASKPAARAFSNRSDKGPPRDKASFQDGRAARHDRTPQRADRAETAERPSRQRFDRPKGAAGGPASGRGEARAPAKTRMDGAQRGASSRPKPAGRPAPSGGHAQKRDRPGPRSPRRKP